MNKKNYVNRKSAHMVANTKPVEHGTADSDLFTHKIWIWRFFENKKCVSCAPEEYYEQIKSTCRIICRSNAVHFSPNWVEVKNMMCKCYVVYKLKIRNQF